MNNWLDRSSGLRESPARAQHWNHQPSVPTNWQETAMDPANPAGGRAHASPGAIVDESLEIESLRVPVSLQPTPKPGMVEAPQSGIKLFAGVLLAIGVAGAFALVIGGKLASPGTSRADQAANDPSSFDRPGSAPPAASGAAVPKLVIHQPPARRAGETYPLGVSVRDPGDFVLVVGGLADGTTLSVGQSAGADRWRLASSDLSEAVIRPPRDFVGGMELMLELRTMDGSIADRRSLRFAWAQAAAEVRNKEASLRLDPPALASLLKRGDELIASGDLAAARLVLNRAAKAGDARAALTLAGTYDPMVLERLGVHGFIADIAIARSWYENALRFGSPEAPSHLQMLANRQQ